MLKALQDALSGAAPAALTASLILLQVEPLPRMIRWGAWGLWLAVLASLVGGVGAYLVPARSAIGTHRNRWGVVLVAGVLAVLVAGWYVYVAQSPPDEDDFEWYYYGKTPGLYCLAYFLGSYSISRGLITVASVTARPPKQQAPKADRPAGP